MNITLDDSEKNAFGENLKQMFQDAYEQGLQDGIEKASLPHTFRKKDVATYFQVSLATVENIIRMDGFPKSRIVSARYPKDLVIKWANENVDVLYLHQKAKDRARAV